LAGIRHMQHRDAVGAGHTTAGELVARFELHRNEWWQWKVLSALVAGRITI
jgi:hypothetical protein